MTPVYLHIAYTPEKEEKIVDISECYQFEYIILQRIEDKTYICTTDSIVLKTDNIQLSRDTIVRKATCKEVKNILQKASIYYEHSDVFKYINEWLLQNSNEAL